MQLGRTYTFKQAHRTNYYHPMGFSYYADGAHADLDELEPGITPPGSNSACADFNACPAPMYFMDGEYLGTYSNIQEVKNVTTMEDDFGLDSYEPLFFRPIPEWTEFGEFEIKLRFDNLGYTQDLFYFCHVSIIQSQCGGFLICLCCCRGCVSHSVISHIRAGTLLLFISQIHEFMSGRIKLLNGNNLVQPDEKLPEIPYEYDEPSTFDQKCGTYGLDPFQLPHPQCPERFVCNVPESNEPLAQFADCIEAMDCHMLVVSDTCCEYAGDCAVWLSVLIVLLVFAHRLTHHAPLCLPRTGNDDQH